MARSEEIDALMMGYLYGELDESEERAFQAKLEDDPELEAEIASLRRTREAFNQLPDEEPPAAVSAQLLHEAAKRAPAGKRAHTVEERPGFWERLRIWFQPIVAHPAAASLAGLLLVAGVAGALYMRGVDAPVGPNVRSEAPAPGPAPAASAALESAPEGAEVATGQPGYFANSDKLQLDGVPADEAQDPTGGLMFEDNRADSLQARLAEPEQERALREQEELAKKGEVYRAAPRKNDAVRKPIAGGKAGRGWAEKDVPLANAVSGADPLIVPEESAPETKSLDRGKGGGGGATRDLGVASEKSKAPPPADAWKPAADKKQDEDTTVARQAPARNAPAAQAAEPEPSYGAGDDDYDFADAEGESVAPTSTGSRSAQKKRPTYRVYKDKRTDNWAKSMHGKLNRTLENKKLSKRKRCNEAAEIANDLLDRNPEYFYAKVEDSKRLMPCKPFVAKEMRSRRAKRRKAAGKQSGQAAPAAADEAAESAQ